MAVTDQQIRGWIQEAEAITLRSRNKHYTTFYSNPWLTLSRGDLYVAGSNPAGDYTQTFRVLEAEHPRDAPWSKYIDEKWDRATLQNNIQRFFAEFWSVDALRNAFSTNAVFWTGEVGKADAALYTFEECWPLHKQFLEIVRPKIILAFGSAADRSYGMFRSKMQNRNAVGEIPGAYMNMAIRIVDGTLPLASGDHPVRLVGLPHFSQWHVHKSLPHLQTLKANGWLP